MEDEYTTVRVRKGDAERLNSFKVHEKQPDSEAFAVALNMAEAHKREAKK